MSDNRSEALAAGTRAFRGNCYAGRTVVVGRDPTGRYWVLATLIEGRSPSSRNRRYVERTIGSRRTGIVRTAFVTEPASPPPDADNLIYDAMVETRRGIFVGGNGAHVTAGLNALMSGGLLEHGQRSWSYEADPPGGVQHRTPRIMAAVLPNFAPPLQMAAVRCAAGSTEPERKAWSFSHEEVGLGEGRYLTTYSGDAPEGEALPSYRGDPLPIALSGSLHSMALYLWDMRPAATRVALALKFIHTATGTAESYLISAA